MVPFNMSSVDSTIWIKRLDCIVKSNMNDGPIDYESDD